MKSARVSSPEEIERAVCSVVEEFPTIKLAILFGSAAKGGLRPDSDIDLAVAGDLPLGEEISFQLMGHVAAALGRAVDLLDLSVVSGPVLGEALRGRIFVKKDPAVLARVMRRQWHWEADVAPIWRAVVQERIANVFK